MNEFFEATYNIDGKEYFSFADIGSYFFPEKLPVDAMNKIRYIYKYRKNDLEKFSRKAKCWWSNQTIVVLTLEGIRELCKFVKRSDYNEQIGKFIKRYDSLRVNC